MLAALPTLPEGEHVPTADHRVILHQVPWSHFEAQLALRGDRSSPRISYLEGTMELMSPSRDHERIKSYIGRLIEAYALEVGIDFSPYGGWTLKQRIRKAGAEPDECYIVGADPSQQVPDLAIEVIWTSGGLDKLEIYRRLGVAEVVIWKAGRVDVYALRGHAYRPVRRSRFFPGLDFAVLASFLDLPTASQAVRAFRETLHKRKRGVRLPRG
jgi:Uma2 family endonuclease